METRPRYNPDGFHAINFDLWGDGAFRLICAKHEGYVLDSPAVAISHLHSAELRPDGQFVTWMRMIVAEVDRRERVREQMNREERVLGVRMAHLDDLAQIERARAESAKLAGDKPDANPPDANPPDAS